MKKIFQTILGFGARLSEDRVSAYASQAAYFFLMSFIPILMLLMTLVQYTPITQGIVTDVILQIVPDNAELRAFFLNIINEVYSKSASIVPISAVFTLWSAGKGVQALNNGVNSIYHVTETRNYFVMRFRSALYTLLFIVAVAGTLLVLVFGNTIQGLFATYIPVLARITAYIIGMRTGISLLALILILLVIYRFLPNRKVHLRNQIPGAVIGGVSWSLFSLGFSIYLDVYDGMSNMYGSLTTIILVLLWLYFIMYITLIGAEINAYFEEKIERMNEMAKDKIREEYHDLINGLSDRGKDNSDVDGEIQKTEK